MSDNEKTNIDDWLCKEEWVSLQKILTGSLLIQNVVDDSVAIVVDASRGESNIDLDDPAGWFVYYYCNKVLMGNWASEMWQWKIIK